MAKKILVIVESLDVNDSSATKGRVAFIESLKKAGFSVTVLHYTQREIKLPGIDCNSIHERKKTINYLLSRFQRLLYRWFKINIAKYIDSLFGFSFGFFNDVNSISSVLRKYESKDFKMLWTFGKGTSFRVHAAVLNNPSWYHIWYAFVHDPYPQHLYPRPYNFVEYGFKKKRYFFRDITINAYRMVFPSLLLKDWMQSYFSHVEGKSLIIPHQMSKMSYSKTKLPYYFDVNKFNLLHAGNLLDLRDPKPLVLAFEKFLLEMPSAKGESMLLFLGSKSIFDDYLYKKQQVLSELYVSDGYVNFDEVYAMQNQASVNIILEAKSEISPFLPGKFPHCVTANKPILVVGPYYSECKRLLGEDYSYVFDFNEVDEIKESIKSLYFIWKENKHLLTLNRPDLEYYISSNYLKEVIEE
jgi:hypothetical protein